MSGRGRIDRLGWPWDNAFSMKNALALILVLAFTASMVHCFYGEDHSSSRLPSSGEGFAQALHLHGISSTCLCFSVSFLGPDHPDWGVASDFRVSVVPAGMIGPGASLCRDIAHPPQA